MHNRPTDFNALVWYEEQGKFIDRVSDSTLQLRFKKLPLVQLSSIKEQSQLSKKTIKIFLPLPTTDLYEAGFSSYTSIKTIYHNRLNAETNVRN